MCKQIRFQILTTVISVVLLAIGVDAFTIQTTSRSDFVSGALSDGGGTRSNPYRRFSVLRRNSKNNESDENNDEKPILSSASPNSAMSETSRLSHAMLKVPSVDAAVDYWISKGGEVERSRSNGKSNGEAKILSAFVKLGYIGSSSSSSSSSQKKEEAEDGESEKVDKADEAPKSFSIEIVRAPARKSKKDDIGNKHGLSYLGLSMLLKFKDKNPLLELMMGNPTDATTADKSESNTSNKDESDEELFPIKYVASAPGDGFAQLALLSNNKLVETCDFYTTVLGMDQKAQDQNLLCLRYNPSIAPTDGVATTLVFENRPRVDNDEEDAKCFDHLAIETTSSVDGLYRELLKENESPVKVYMKPTPMFGSFLLGLIDPNGYKVVVYGTNE